MQDLPASENSLFYMFQSLSPSVKYQVSVAMRNGEGEGPPATVLVTTPALPTGKLFSRKLIYSNYLLKSHEIFF